MSFLLKIVDGPNKGAEVALVDGVAVTLGKDDGCDIVLADSFLPDTPLKIETSADGVAVDGSLIEPLHVMTVGNTSFAVGPAERAWGKLVWPEDEASKSEEHKAEDGEATVDKPSTPQPSDEKPSKRKHGCLVSFVVLLILAGILAGLGWYYREWLMPKVEPYRPQAEAAWGWTRDHAKDAYRWCYKRYDGWVEKRRTKAEAAVEAETERDPAELIAEIALRYGLDISDVDGRLSLTGNLKTRAERLAATAEAYEALPCIELSLSDDETLKTAVEDTLTLIGEADLRVRTVTNRVAVLDGGCSDFAMVMMQISQEVPKISQIDGGSVQRPVAVVQDIEEGASEPMAQQSAVFERPATPAAVMPTLPVCGILTMPYPCLVTRSGSRIMEGATFGEWTVRKINADSVLLESQTGRFLWRP